MPRRRQPTEDDGTPRRPTAVVLLPEHGEYLFNRSPFHLQGWNDYVVDPVELGVSADLIAAMVDWNSRYAPTADYGWETPEDARVWEREGLTLAYRLQHELGEDIEVRYPDLDGVERPVIGRRGP